MIGFAPALKREINVGSLEKKQNGNKDQLYIFLCFRTK
jgi:hypothetical protein